MPAPPVRDPERVLEALSDLVQAMRQHDLRIGQAIANAMLVEFGPTAELARLFYVEDDKFAELISRHADRMRAEAKS